MKNVRVDSPQALATHAQAVYQQVQAAFPDVRIIPIAMGDNIQSIPLIGTDLTFFELRRTMAEPPAFRTSSAVWVASGWAVAAAPLGATTAEREAIGARARACYLDQFDREQAFRQLERWIAELRKPG
jgi:hypothetical protein